MRLGCRSLAARRRPRQGRPRPRRRQGCGCCTRSPGRSTPAAGSDGRRRTAERGAAVRVRPTHSSRPWWQDEAATSCGGGGGGDVALDRGESSSMPAAARVRVGRRPATRRPRRRRPGDGRAPRGVVTDVTARPRACLAGAVPPRTRRNSTRGTSTRGASAPAGGFRGPRPGSPAATSAGSPTPSGRAPSGQPPICAPVGPRGCGAAAETTPGRAGLEPRRAERPVRARRHRAARGPRRRRARTTCPARAGRHAAPRGLPRAALRAWMLRRPSARIPTGDTRALRARRRMQLPGRRLDAVGQARTPTAPTGCGGGRGGWVPAGRRRRCQWAKRPR